jgi:hypothetical protein
VSGTRQRLIRAAQAEYDRVDSERGRLRERISALTAEIEQLQTTDRMLAGQARLLSELMAERADPSDAPGVIIRGARLREEAVRVLIEQWGVRRPIHYHEWYRLFQETGLYVILSKRPIAMFLTTATRSPLVRRGRNEGVYYIEPAELDRLNQELAERQAELRDVDGQIAAGEYRLTQYRMGLLASTRRVERQVAEATRVLNGAALEAVSTHA